MLRFTIRDVLWLTVVVGLALGWWLLWRSIPIDAKASGSINVAGKPVSNGCVYFHSTDGQIIGARVVKGQFRIHKAPVGQFRVSIESDDVASRYSGDKSELSVEVRRGVNTFDFDLRP
jgi:hypothetical protein